MKNIALALFVLSLSIPAGAQRGQDRPQFSFGVIADVQYADQPTAGARHYRDSLQKLAECVADLNEQKLSFVVQLGDLIDTGPTSFDAVLPVWDKLRAPRRHVLGNHDLPFARTRVMARLGLARGYYDFVEGDWRFVVLDGMDVSLHGYPRGHAKRREATQMLASLKAKKVKNAQPWNGGIGKEQLVWLRATLQDAEAKGQRVVLSCHFPLLAEASSAHHLLWNHAEVLRVIEEYPCVAAWMNGHDHSGGYALRNGIHHVTVSGMVEAPKRNAYGVVDVHADRLELRGVGKQRTLTLALKSPARSPAKPPAKSARKPETERPKQPNILWITCEDISPHLGCYGDSYAVTPNIDALAREGVLYENAFATIGVCAPARSTIITGMYPPSIGSQHMRCNIRLPRSVRGFPAYLRAGGYYCTNNSKTDYNLQIGKDVWDRSSRQAHWRGRQAGQPFFAVFNFTSCHESQIRLKEAQDVQRTKDFTEAERHDPARATPPPYHPNTPEVRRDWARYADMITFMDKQVARVLRELKEDGLEEDTIVFFYSDHGAGMPRSKRWLYDSSLRVPMIVRVPEKYREMVGGPEGGKAGARTDRLVSFVDLAPTVLSLAGIEIPEAMQGRAFLGHNAIPARQHVFGFRDRMDERYDMMRCVGDGRFKLIRNYMPHRIYGQYLDYMYQMPTMRVWQQMHDAGQLTGPQTAFFGTKPREELYDTKVDPHEVKNLAGDPKHRAILDRLRGRLDTWMEEIVDLGLLPEAELRGRFGNESPYDVVRRESRRYPLKEIKQAADLVGRRDPAALATVTKSLSSREPAVRYWSAIACTAFGAAAAPAIPRLQTALGDDSPDVRIAAAEALCVLGATTDALPVLRQALAHESPWVRLRAITQLDRLDASAAAARDDLRAAKKDKNKYVARVAEKALRDLEK